MRHIVENRWEGQQCLAESLPKSAPLSSHKQPGLVPHFTAVGHHHQAPLWRTVATSCEIFYTQQGHCDRQNACNDGVQCIPFYTSIRSCLLL